MGLEDITSEASFKALEALNSPSAATIFALASRKASASAAMALCMATGRRTSLLENWKLSNQKVAEVEF